MNACLFPILLALAPISHPPHRNPEASPWIANNYEGGRIPDGSIASGATAQSIGGVAAACCIGSDCSILEQDECEAQGGYFVGAAFCGSFCAFGACCLPGPECRDDDGVGGRMDESLCQQFTGDYVGGAGCDGDGDPCDLSTIPDGYEVIDIAGGNVFHHRPRINNCGQIVYYRNFAWHEESEIFRYDNGVVDQITNNNLPDGFPDINDLGDIVWNREYRGDEFPGTIVALRDNNVHVIGIGDVPAVNAHLDIVWYQLDGSYWDCSPSVAGTFVFHFDHEQSYNRHSDGYSNQGAQVNDFGELTWTRYLFPCNGGFGDWTSEILLATLSEIRFLDSQSDTPQGANISDAHRVIWNGSLPTQTIIEVYQDGQTSTLTEGSGPSIALCPAIAYHYKTSETPYELRLLLNSESLRISPEADISSVIDNYLPDINDHGEVAWNWHPNGSLTPAGIRFMRRIRTGDVDVDDDVDIADFARFPGCYTGPVITDGLCVCRFLDIDHDRDVDWDDFNLFMGNYTGPATDCMGRTMWDLADGIIAGTIQDCNVNGIDDACEIQNSEGEEELSQSRGERGEKNELTTGSDSLRPLRLRVKSSDLPSLDANGNGVPDECDCPAFQPIHTNAMPSIKNRYLSFTPRVSYWTPMTAFIDPPLEGKRAAIRVKLVDLDRFPQLNGQVRWVGPPSTYPDVTTPFGEFIAAELQCEPYYQDWGHSEYMHVFGSAIVPNSTYEVQIVAESCRPPLLDESKFSPPVTIVTREWGDVFEPFGGPSQPNFSDITRIVDAFRQAEGAIVKPRAQLQPQVLNPAGNVTFADISACVDGFRGFVYPYTVAACP